MRFVLIAIGCIIALSSAVAAAPKSGVTTIRHARPDQQIIIYVWDAAQPMQPPSNGCAPRITFSISDSNAENRTAQITAHVSGDPRQFTNTYTCTRNFVDHAGKISNDVQITVDAVAK